MRYVNVGKSELASGVTYNRESNTFNFDFTKEDENELISLTDIALYQSSMHTHVYLYGYRFKENVPKDVRKEFVVQIKGLSKTKINSVFFKKFLTRLIVELGNKLYDITAVLYPSSQRTQINVELVKYIRKFALVDSKDFLTLDFVKSLPQEVEFDYTAFEQDEDNEQYGKWLKVVNNVMKKIHNLNDYFSMSKNVDFHMRPYIRNFLKIREHPDLLSKIDGGRILLVDDINTTGSTLVECIRAINRVAIPKQIIVFTLLGKSYADLA